MEGTFPQMCVMSPPEPRQITSGADAEAGHWLMLFGSVLGLFECLRQNSMLLPFGQP